MFKIRSGPFHTFYSTSKPEKYIKVGNKNKKNKDQLYKLNPKHKKHVININTFSSSPKELSELLKFLDEVDANKDEIVTYVGGDGGRVREGIDILSKYEENDLLDTTAAVMSETNSMGSIFFVHFKRREISAYTTMMFHAISSGMGGKAKSVRDYGEHLHEYQDILMRDLLVTNTQFFTEEEYQLMLEGKDYYLLPHHLCERGIATHVRMPGNTTITAKQFLARSKR